MKKHLVFLFTLFLSAGFSTVKAQGKPIFDHRLFIYSAKGKEHPERTKIQFGVKASADDKSLNIFCDPKKPTSPCAFVYPSSSIPPAIPKCQSEICHPKIFFIREKDRYSMKIILDGKVSVWRVKTTGPEFDRMIQSTSNATFTETQTKNL